MPGQSGAPPGPLKLLLLRFLGLLRLLRLLRFLSHSILSGLEWIETRHERHARRRASLAKSSHVNSADSQAAAPHRHAAVMALSTDVMRFDALEREVFRKLASGHRLSRAFDRVNDAPTCSS